MSAINFDRDLTFVSDFASVGLASVTTHLLADFPKVITDGVVRDGFIALNRSNTATLVVPTGQVVSHGVNLKKPVNGERLLYRLKGFSYSRPTNVQHALFVGIIDDAPSNVAAGQVCTWYQVLRMSEGLDFDETIAVPWSDDITGSDVSNRQLTFGLGVINLNSTDVTLRWNYHLSVQALDQRPPDYISEMR